MRLSDIVHANGCAEHNYLWARKPDECSGDLTVSLQIKGFPHTNPHRRKRHLFELKIFDMCEAH